MKPIAPNLSIEGDMKGKPREMIGAEGSSEKIDTYSNGQPDHKPIEDEGHLIYRKNVLPQY